MKLKLIVAATVLMTIIACMPIVQGTITISDVTMTPQYPKQGDTIMVKAKVTATENITAVRLLNCWEKPTYICGMPATMTSPKNDSFYTGSVSNAAWTTGNIVHLNVSVDTKSGDNKLYTIPSITIGYAPPPDPANITTQHDCETAGFFWWNSECHAKAQQASDFKNETTCQGAGHYWWSNQCNDQKGTPDKYTEESACTHDGFFWYDNKCNADKQKEKPPAKFIPNFEAGFAFVAITVAGVALLGRKVRIRK